MTVGFLTNVFQTQKEAEQLTTGSDQAKDTSTHTFPTDSFVHTYQHLQMHKHTYVSMYMYLCMLYDLHKSTLTQFAPAEKLLVNNTLTAILSPPLPHSKKKMRGEILITSISSEQRQTHKDAGMLSLFTTTGK